MEEKTQKKLIPLFWNISADNAEIMQKDWISFVKYHHPFNGLKLFSIDSRYLIKEKHTAKVSWKCT